MSDSTSTYSNCPRCGSTNLVEQTGESEPTSHYGRLLCGNCGKFLQWLPNPAITASFEERQQLIDIALASGRVTGWENLFLRRIKETRTLSLKQKEKFDQICARHGFTKIPASSGTGAGADSE